jgi:hypothetical protein
MTRYKFTIFCSLPSERSSFISLVCVAQYRGDFGARLRETSDRVIEGKVLQLEPIVNEKQKPAA